MKQMKRLCSLLLVFALTLGCLSGLCLTVSAEEADSPYHLYVGNVAVTSSNANDVLGDGKVRFDPDTFTLYLNNANITDTHNCENFENIHPDYQYSACILYEYAGGRDLTIELTGTNSVGTKTVQYGICCNRKVILTGSGSLNVKGKTAIVTISGGVVLQSGKVIATGYEKNAVRGAAGGTIWVNGGELRAIVPTSVTASDTTGIAIYTRSSFHVDGGTVYAAATQNAKAIYAESKIYIGRTHLAMNANQTAQLVLKDEKYFTIDGSTIAKTAYILPKVQYPITVETINGTAVLDVYQTYVDGMVRFMELTPDPLCALTGITVTNVYTGTVTPIDLNITTVIPPDWVGYTFYMPDAPVKVRVEFQRYQHKVRFLPGYGSGTMEDVALTFDENGEATYTLPSASTFDPPENAPDGTILGGWYVNDGTDVIPCGTELTLTDDLVLTAVWKENHNDPDLVIDFFAWNETDSLPEEGNYFLLQDVTLTEPHEIGEGKSLNLCLNGKTITQTGENACVLDVKGLLTLHDPTGTGAVTGGTDSGIKVYGVMLLSGGNVTGNSSAGNGGGIWLSEEGSIFIMKGGSVIGNSAAGNGGGIYAVTYSSWLPGASFTDGTISGNTAGGNGGGVYVSVSGSSQVAFQNMVITDNVCDGIGGGIYCAEDTTISLDSGAITGNTAGTAAGGVYVGGAVVSAYEFGNVLQIIGNTADGIASNLHLTAGKKLVFNEKINIYTSDVTIGFTTEDVPVPGAPVVLTENIPLYAYLRMSSDNEAYSVQLIDDEAVLSDILTVTLLPGLGSGDPVFEYVYEGGEYRLPNYNNHPFTQPMENGGGLVGWLVNDVPEIVPPNTLITITEATTVTALWMEKHDSNYFEPWIYTDHLPVEPGNWYLLNDVTLTETWEVPATTYQNNTNRLCLFGRTITRTGTGSAIHIASGSKLEILDHEGGVITGANRSAITVDNGATLTINGGTFTGNSAANNEKGGVIYNAGTVTINDGTFTGNSVGGRGAGGVFANFGTFRIHGGVFTDNSGGEAGVGFNAAGATLEINGGTFSNNRNTYNGYGGGGFVNNGEMFVYGGTISGNRAITNGGAIWNGNGGSLALDGPVVITENFANDGGGIFCRADYSEFSVSSSPRVFGNTRTGGGASNIYLKDGVILTCFGTGVDLLLGITAEAAKPVAITNVIAGNYNTRPDDFLSDDPAYLPGWSDNHEIMLTRAYVIHFDANGGSGTMEDIRTLESSAALPECGFDAPAGRHFKCWSCNDAEISGSFTFTVGTYNYTLKPVWEPNVYNVVIEGNSENGTVSAEGDTAHYGDTVTLTVTPAEGFALDSLTVSDGEGNPVSLTGDMSFIMPASDVTVSAVFRAVDYTITLNDTVYGLVEADMETANIGQTVTLTLIPDMGFEVDHIIVTDAEGNELPMTGDTFVMPASDVIVTVVFREIIYFTVTVAEVEHGTVTADKESASKGESVTLTVTPDENYVLAALVYRWNDCEGSDFTVDETAQTYTFQMPEGNVEIIASFIRLVPYIDAAGNDMTPIADYTVLTAETTDLTGGWYVAMDTVTIPERVTVSGTVNLILCDGAELNVPKGITVDKNNTLVIWQQRGDNVGRLIAGGSTPNYYAGIGGSQSNNSSSVTASGDITVNGGVITARGGYEAAGIGGGYYKNAGNITINAGSVIAYGGQRGAGIGGGERGSAGNTTINGGVVTAEGATEYYGGTYSSGAGIGGGNKGAGGSITVNGGTVTAKGGNYSAGIGGGYNAGAGTILITGGKVHAADGGIGTSTWPYFTYSGTVTLRWTEETKDTMEVYALSYRGQLTLEMPFCDRDTHAAAYTGTIEDVTLLAGKTLIPCGWPVTVECGEHGSVVADPNLAFQGETVTLTVTPETGYKLELLIVTDASGNPIELTNNTFIMPESSVTVTAEFVRDVPDGYYLIGPDWTADAIAPDNKFVENPNAQGEYMLQTTLAEGDEIKAVHVTNGAINVWYPDGVDNQYTVDAAHAGNVTVYFKPYYDSAWAAFGGYIWIEPAAQPEPEYNANLQLFYSFSLSEEITPVYTITSASVSDYADYYVVIEKTGAAPVTIGKDDMGAVGTSGFKAPYTGIAAKEMGVEFTATLYAVDNNGAVFFGPSVTKTIKNELVTRLSGNASDITKKLSADMLNYGAAAQVYFGYDVENLVNANVDHIHEYETTADPAAQNLQQITGDGGQIYQSASLSNRVVLQLTGQMPYGSDVKLKVMDADGALLCTLDTTAVNTNLFRANFDQVGAKDMRTLYKFQFVDEGGTSDDSKVLTWSVESFVFQKMRDNAPGTPTYEMARALLIFGDTAAEYLGG